MFKMNFRLEDSTIEKVPPKLEEAVKVVISNRRSTLTVQKDLFSAIIVFIMTENGFDIVGEDKMESSDYKIVDTGHTSKEQQKSEVIEIVFMLSGFSEIQVKLIICPLDTTFLINVFINNVNTEVYSICLPISQYVVSPEATTIPLMFRDLKQLSHIFKNKIITPVKSTILKQCGYCSASLLGLPEELLLNILLKLPIIDIISTTKTCKRLASLLENTNLWHKLFLRDFKNEVNNESKDESTWKKLYKEAYTAKQNARTRSTTSCLRGTLHDLMDFSDFVSYIDNPLWDVII